MSEKNWIKDSVKNVLYESIYQTGKEIGRRPFQTVGSASFTFFCKDKKTGKEWVLKTLQKRVKKSVTQCELGNLLRLNHPNIARLKEVFESSGYIQIISEAVYGIQLFDALADLPKYSEQDLAFCMREILKGLCYLHENGLSHRSLKPRNLMYCDTPDGPLVKILDVSFTTILGRDTEMEMVCGDSTFCAPEVLLSHQYGTSVDMWALGVLLFLMICGTEPFQRAEEGETFRSILQASYELNRPEWGTVTMHAKDVIKRLLVVDPLIRMTAAQTLKHDWILGDATPDLHLPASQFALSKYNKRSAKKATSLRMYTSLDARKHVEHSMKKIHCSPVRFEKKAGPESEDPTQSFSLNVWD